MSTNENTWPVLNTYEDEFLSEVVFPMGGIGTGTIGLGGRAELRDFEICNRPDKGFTPPWSFFSLRTQIADETPVVRVLEGAIQPPYSGSHGVMLANKGVPRHPMLRSSGSGLPRMSQVRLEAAYPFARYTLTDPDVPLIVQLEAFNPLIPLDVDRSSLPVAVLRYVLTNPTDQPVRASLAGSLYNFMGRQPRLDGTSAFIGGNINEARQNTRGDSLLHGLLLRSESVPAQTPEDGTMALVVLGQEPTGKPLDNTSVRCSWGGIEWSRNLRNFWEDFSRDGQVHDVGSVEPSPEGEGQCGSVAASLMVAPGATTALTFLLCWHFPHRTTRDCGWETRGDDPGWVGNYYATHYTDAWDVAEQVAPQLKTLEQESLRFTRTLVSTSLPQSVKEAALNNISTLRSETCFRTADGHFFGFEGCWDDLGCCAGSCTHVWNYELTTSFLFPQLAQDMRVIELDYGTLENGLNCFRVPLPLGTTPTPRAAADGQMGVVMKCYREWQLSGDDGFLREHWQTIRSLLEFCWLPGGWDADQDGVMEGVQHNTSDIEFFGPNPLSGIWYLGALRAGEEMATALGDAQFASKCQNLFARGRAWIDANLFNGEYYVQQIRTPSDDTEQIEGLTIGLGATDLDNPEFQVGNGCLADQLVGQYMAHATNLGYLVDPHQTASALHSIYRYNFITDIGAWWNNLRSYVLDDESGLVVCTWPHDDAPDAPFFRFCEVWTGVEYQAAAHMIYEGLVDEGLAVASAIRARFDGRRRNPWNESECGHHYARAMASWALVLALNGFRYSAVSKELGLTPALETDSFDSIWSIPAGWGSVRQRIEHDNQRIEWHVLAGELPVTTMHYAVPNGQTCATVTAQVGQREIGATLQQQEQHVTVSLSETTSISSGDTLAIRLSFSKSKV